MKIEIGFAYQTVPKFKESKIYTIIHMDKNRSERPYIGISTEGCIEFFDQYGADEWFECGGHWNKLDLETKMPAKFKLEEITQSPSSELQDDTSATKVGDEEILKAATEFALSATDVKPHQMCTKAGFVRGAKWLQSRDAARKESPSSELRESISTSKVGEGSAVTQITETALDDSCRDYAKRVCSGDKQRIRLDSGSHDWVTCQVDFIAGANWAMARLGYRLRTETCIDDTAIRNDDNA